MVRVLQLDKPRSAWHSRRIIYPLLLILSAIPYFQLVGQEFINYDDDIFVTENSHVLTGVSWDNTVWAFEIHGPSQYHPLTWLSHQLDCQLFGLNASAHKLHNLLLHLITSLLIFELLLRLLPRPPQPPESSEQSPQASATTPRLIWTAALLALIWSIHPLRVQVVAWVAERKELLGGVFGFGAMLAWLWYAAKPGFIRYAVVFLLTVLALLSKPMWVTLPAVFLLLDFYPLGRLPLPRTWQDWRTVAWRLAEKLPFALPVVVASYLTVLCQIDARAINPTDVYPVALRIPNVALAYWWYVWKLVAPTDLVVLNRMIMLRPLEVVLPALAGLLTVSYAALRVVKRWPAVTVGWLIFLGTLLPAVGLVQVGGQSWADRYTYLPHLGLLLILGAAALRLMAWSTQARDLLRVVAVLFVLVLLLATAIQVTFWQDSVVIFTRTLDYQPRNPSIQNNLGAALLRRGQTEPAMYHFQQAMLQLPGDFNSLMNIGRILNDNGRPDVAVAWLQLALRQDPESPKALTSMATALAKLGKTDLAVETLRHVIANNPDHWQAWHDLGAVYQMRDNLDEAIQAYTKARDLNPRIGLTHRSLGLALLNAGRREEGLASLRRTLELNPEDDIARRALRRDGP